MAWHDTADTYCQVLLIQRILYSKSHLILYYKFINYLSNSAHGELEDNLSSRSTRLAGIEDELGRIESLLASSGSHDQTEAYTMTSPRVSRLIQTM